MAAVGGDGPPVTVYIKPGFANYVKSVGDGALSPQVAVDGYGRRNGKMTAAVNDGLHALAQTEKRLLFGQALVRDLLAQRQR